MKTLLIAIVLAIAVPDSHQHGFHNMDRMFKTMVEIVDVGQGETIATVEEFYEAPNMYYNFNFGALKIHDEANKVHRLVVYNSSSDEAYSVDMNTQIASCEEQLISNGLYELDKKYQWHWYYNNTGSVIFGPSALISAYNKDATFANKREVVRGINTHKYTVKVNSMNVSFWVAADNGTQWSDPDTDGHSKVVKMHIVGTPEKNVQIDVIYNFILIDDMLTEDDFLLIQVPVGRGCPGTNRRSPGTVVAENSNFKVRGELVIAITSDQTTNLGMADFTIYYEQSNNAYAVLQQTYSKDNRKKMHSNGYNYTIVMDQVGYKYTYRQNHSSCYIEKDEEFGLDFNLPNGNILHVESPEKLFDFHDFPYLGIAKVRGYYTRVYEKKYDTLNKAPITYDPFFSLPGIITYYEYDSSLNQRDRSSYYSKYRPLKTEIRILDPSQKKVVEKIEFNLFDFDTLDINTNMLSISHCVDSVDDMYQFQLTFKGDIFDGIEYYREDIISSFKSKLIDQDISPLRVVNPEVTFQTDTFKVSAVLLERPSALVDFYHGRDKTAFVNDKVVKSFLEVNSEEDCAKLCLTYDGKFCESYIWCDFTCSLITTKHKQAYHIPTSKDSYCVAGARQSDLMMKYAVDLLSDIGVAYGALAFGNIFTIEFEGEKYKAVDLNTNIPGNKDTITGRQSFTDHFHLAYSEYALMSNYVDFDYRTTGMELVFESCEGKCQTEDTFYCDSFTYCAETGTCLLSQSFPNAKNYTKLLTPLHGCDTYTRAYIDQYTIIPGEYMKEKGIEYDGIDEDGCAKYCSSDKGIAHCESFDVCYNNQKKSCVLHETHFLDAEASTTMAKGALCSHFARKFSFDFQRISSKAIYKKYISTSYGNITFENCTKICSEADDCTSLSYCRGSSPDCQLTTTSLKTKGLLYPSEVCTYFSKIYNYNGSYTSPQTSKEEIVPSKYSSGTIAGIGVTMIIVGLILGVLAVLLVKKINS